MGVLGTIGRIIGGIILFFLLIIVVLPILLFIAGLTTPLWSAIYNASLHAFGPNSSLTWIVYEIYQFTVYCNKYITSYIIHGGSS